MAGALPLPRGMNRSLPWAGLGLLAIACFAAGQWCGHEHDLAAKDPHQPEVQASVHAEPLSPPAASPTATPPASVAQAPRPAPAAGRPRPTDDQLLQRVRALVGKDDATVRQALVSLFDDLFTVSEGDDPEAHLPFTGRWTLPQEFAEDLLDRIRPLLESAHDVDPPDDDMKVLLVTLDALERMRYAPALGLLLRADGVPALGELTHWTWPRFGAAAVAPLAESVRTGEPRLRAQALVAIREIQDPVAVPELTRLAEGPDADLRAAASEAVRGIGVAADLTRSRATASSPMASFADRREAVFALAARGAASDLDALLARAKGALAMPPPRPAAEVDVAAEAIRALIGRGDPRSISWVLDLVRTRGLDAQANEELRQRAIEDLGLAGVVEAVPLLVAVMNDETDDLRSRWWAALALERLDEGRANEFRCRATELDERWRRMSGGEER